MTEDRIAARYHRTLGLLPAAIRASDFVSLFDNSQRAKPGEAVRLRLFLERDHRAGVERSRPPLPAWWRKIAANESF